MNTVAVTTRSDPKPAVLRSPLIRIAGSVLMLTLLIIFLPRHQLWLALRRIPPSLGMGLLGGYLALHLLGVTKWRLLINLAGADLTFVQAVRCYYMGLFGNIFLPSMIGGDVVRAGMAFGYARSKAGVVLGSLLDRIQDVAALALVAGVGALLIPRSLDAHSRRVFWDVGGIFVLAGACGLGSLRLIPIRKFPLKLRRLVVRVRRGVFSMYRHPTRMLLCLCLSATLQTGLVIINLWLGNATGLHLAFEIWLFAWPLAKLSALLPITQGGIGVREVALVGLLTPFGAPPALTAASGLAFDAAATCGGLVGGAAAFLIGRLTAARASAL